MKNLAKEARERLGAAAANLQRPKRQAKKNTRKDGDGQCELAKILIT